MRLSLVLSFSLADSLDWYHPIEAAATPTLPLAASQIKIQNEVKKRAIRRFSTRDQPQPAVVDLLAMVRRESFANQPDSLK
jgi:hypothetical protein